MCPFGKKAHVRYISDIYENRGLLGKLVSKGRGGEIFTYAQCMRLFEDCDTKGCKLSKDRPGSLHTYGDE